MPTTFEEMTLRNVKEEALQTVALAASRSILIQSMAGADKEPGEEGGFFDCREIARALRAVDAYGRAFGACGSP